MRRNTEQARTGRILAAGVVAETVTKVTASLRALVAVTACVLLVCVMLAAEDHAAQAAATPQVSAKALYEQLASVGLYPGRVYQVRDGALDREDLHISLDDGTIAFTRDVLGRITGAMFEGEGEILVVPPDQAERASMNLFTKAAILEDKFSSAYFRFNDDTYEQLQPALRPAGSLAQDAVSRLDVSARTLAESDALRLLLSFSRLLPEKESTIGKTASVRDDHYLHARLRNDRRGVFDVYFDSMASEQISLGQMTQERGVSYYDVWASFPMRSARAADQHAVGASDDVEIMAYRMRVRVSPPHEIFADALLDMDVRANGQRTVIFELSRFMQVQQVQWDGKPVEFIHNSSLEGTQRARRGNDIIAVIFPESLHTGQHVRLRFVYSGSVLSEAGGGLLYVGARGAWYPNRGMGRAQFDLEFSFPSGWTLLATGKRMSSARTSGSPLTSSVPEEQVSHWVTERPIPLAGFNLGQYVRAVAPAGRVQVEAYAAGVERSFPRPRTDILTHTLPDTVNPVPPFERPPTLAVPTMPIPAHNAQQIANTSAAGIEYWSRRLGPFPYSALFVTQMPGPNSQGWPGLVFLSSFAFLEVRDRANLHLSPVADILYGRLMDLHETAHQWWGDLVMWRSYRDQWLTEGLANYLALMTIENETPADFQIVMDSYRRQLLATGKSGLPTKDAGPVTLGLRLSSSRFPEGYDSIVYGRGTWLIHMLRHMLRDASAGTRKPNSDKDELFWRVLRQVLERYAGKEMTLRDFQSGFEQQLPRSLWFQGHKSLDWFFEGWVNGTAIPRLHLSGVKFGRRGGFTVVSGTIVQDDAPNDLITSVPVYAVMGGRAPVLIGRVFADGHETSFHLSTPATARKLVLDPYHTILAQVR